MNRTWNLHTCLQLPRRKDPSLYKPQSLTTQKYIIKSKRCRRKIIHHSSSFVFICFLFSFFFLQWSFIIHTHTVYYLLPVQIFFVFCCWMFTLWKRVAEMCGCGRRALAVTGGGGVRNERLQGRRSECWRKMEKKTTKKNKWKSSERLCCSRDPPPPPWPPQQFHSIKKGNIKTHQRLAHVAVRQTPPPFSSAQLFGKQNKKKTHEKKKKKTWTSAEFNWPSCTWWR